MTNFPRGCRLLSLAVTTVETHFWASESRQCQAQDENVPRVGFLCWVTCGDAYHEAWRRQCTCHRAGGYEHWRKRGMLLGCKFVDGHGCVTSARMATTSQPRSLARLNIVQKIIQAYSGVERYIHPRLARRCRFVARRAARLCGSPRRTEVEQVKGNTIKLITLSLIAVALSTTAALAQRECAGLAFCGGGGYRWTPSPPYRGIATPPAEAYSGPAKAYPSKRNLNGQRRQQPPAHRIPETPPPSISPTR